MRSETAGKRIARSATDVAGLVGSLANRVRIAKKDRADAREREATRIAVPSVQERQSDLVRFYDRYESMVETLCDAAQYGPTPKLDRAYADARAAYAADYATIRPFLLSFLDFAPEDVEAGLRLNGRTTDAFEALVAAETLDEFLRGDDGGMISRITRTREALNLYAEHLRLLAARGL